MGFERGNPLETYKSYCYCLHEWCCSPRGVTRVCGARGKKQNRRPFIFLFRPTHFLPKVDPLKTCAAKSDKQKNKTTTTTNKQTKTKTKKLYHIFWHLPWFCAPWKWRPGQVPPPVMSLCSPWAYVVSRAMDINLSSLSIAITRNWQWPNSGPAEPGGLWGLKPPPPHFSADDGHSAKKCGGWYRRRLGLYA